MIDLTDSTVEVNARWVVDTVALLQRVADHWQDTDAPIGLEARRLLEAS